MYHRNQGIKRTKTPKLSFNSMSLKLLRPLIYLLKLNNSLLPDHILLKMLYLADRPVILGRYRILIGDQLILTPEGISLLNIQNLINSKQDSIWHKHIKNAQGCLNADLQNPPGDSELSRYEKFILEFVQSAFRVVPEGFRYIDLLPEVMYTSPPSRL